MGRYLFLICFAFFADFIVFVFFEAGTLTEFAVNRFVENKDKKTIRSRKLFIKKKRLTKYNII